MGNCCNNIDQNLNYHTFYPPTDTRIERISKHRREENITRSKSSDLKAKEFTENKNFNCTEYDNPFTNDRPCNVKSASNKQVTTFKMKMNPNRRNSASEFMSGKGSFIRENSNFISDNFSLFQDKEKIFQDDNNEMANDFNLHNFDITNPNSRNSSFIKTNLCLTNLKSIEKKKINSKNEFRLLDPVRETLREHDRILVNPNPYTDDNSTIEKKSSYSQIFQTPMKRKSAQLNKKTSHSFVERKRKKKKISTIPIISAIKKTNIPTKNTISSSEGNLSTQRIENKENFVEYEKLKEFEHLIKPPMKKESALVKHHILNDQESRNFFSLNDIPTHRRFSVDRFKHLFTDVDTKGNVKLSQDIESNKLVNYQTAVNKSYFETRKNKHEPIYECNNFKSNDSHHNIFI